MTFASVRAAAPVRAVQRLRDALARLVASPLPPAPPGHEQLREARFHRRYATASPHILAAGGRVDMIRLPR